MPEPAKKVYDLPTAVTFFLVGMGVGSVLALALLIRRDLEPSLPARALAHSAR